MRKKFAVIIFVLLLLFIWGNSVMSSELSASVSKHFTMIIEKIFRLSGGNEFLISNSEGIVRKLAHFTEFCALGMVSFIILKMDKRPTINGGLILGICALFFPLSDETIQIFSHRGSQILDVWIDLAGFSVGCIILGVIVLFKQRKMKMQAEDVPGNVNLM